MELGWVDVPNPMYRNAKDPLKALTHVSLLPKDVLAIVWWSKNYGIYERFAQKFEQYENQYFHFTINPRRPDLAFIEPDVPPVDEAVRQVGFLAKLPGGPDMIAWRYDPLVFWNDRTTGEALSTWDPEFFASMCQEMTQRGVTKCFTSFADHFLKFRQRVRDFFPNIELRLQTDQETECSSFRVPKTIWRSTANPTGTTLGSCGPRGPALMDDCSATSKSCIPRQIPR
jgi:hypothetical protein